MTPTPTTSARDLAQARAYGISGVPFFVLDGRLGVSGAQPTELFTEALAQAWSQANPLTLAAPAGAVCDDYSCAV